MAGQEDLPITPYFEETINDLRTENSYVVLAKAAGNLLGKFEEAFKSVERSTERQPCQIKFFPTTGEMRLRYDAITWFDHILPHQLGSRDDCAGHGSKYVSECLTRKHENDIGSPRINKADRFPSSQRAASSCVCHPRKPNLCRICIPKDCLAEIADIQGGTEICGQSFSRATIMDLFFTDKEQFALHSRLESTRDILLFPVIHTSNEDFVAKKSTWESIFKVENRLLETLSYFQGGKEIRNPVESIYFNFGSWMTAMDKNVFLKNAHAHVHLLLTPIAISMLSRDAIQRVYPPREIPLYVLNLTGCHRDPVDYEYDDAITLQSSRILSYHIIETEKNISQIKDSVKLLEKNTMKEESMKIIMREMLTEFLERKQSEPSSPLTLSNDPNQSTSSNAISNDGKNDSASEETMDTNLYPETPSAPSNSEVPKTNSNKKKRKKKRKKKKKKGEPPSPLTLSNDPNQSTSSNAISNDGKNDSPSEENVDTNLYPETPSAPSNILLRGYCYFFIPVIILIFAIVYYQWRQGRLFAFPPFAHSIPKRTSTTWTSMNSSCIKAKVKGYFFLGNLGFSAVKMFPYVSNQ